MKKKLKEKKTTSVSLDKNHDDNIDFMNFNLNDKVEVIRKNP